MPNIATVLKEEISRVARKQSRADTQALKKSSSQQRADIAALKRKVQELERLVKKVLKASGRSTPKPAEDDSQTVQRYSAKGLAAQRKRLGLSAAETALILGVSSLSIYKWESGATRPRQSHMPAIAKLRTLSKGQAAELLSSLKN
jgi:DNA-binding transcriptional regulator YiaG